MNNNTTQQAWELLSERLDRKYGHSIELYIKQLDLIYMNFPEWKFYPTAKSDLAEFIRLVKQKPGEMWGEWTDTFMLLWDRLREWWIITDWLEWEIQRQNNIKNSFSEAQEVLVEHVGVKWKVLQLLDWTRGK